MAKQRTITLTDRPPVKIDDETWPLIAQGDAHGGEHSFQAGDAAWIRVRRHEDGRTIVYGYAGDGDGGGRPTREDRRAGYLVADPDTTVAAIHDVMRDLADVEYCGSLVERSGRECIADLPAEELS